jgi:hypothetical protein
VADDIAAGDTENTGTPETTPQVSEATETPEVAPAKPRKTRARKPKETVVEVDAETAESSNASNVVAEPTTIASSAPSVSVDELPNEASVFESSVSETPSIETPEANSAPATPDGNDETSPAPATIDEAVPPASAEPGESTNTSDEAVAEEAKKPAPKKRAARKTPAKTTAADRKTTRKKTAPTPAVSETSDEAKTSATPVEPVENIDDSAPAASTESTVDEHVVELTEATKRRRKPVATDDAGETEEAGEKKPATKRRTAASAKTAAPRTRKTIKPADEIDAAAASPEATDADGTTDDAKPKRRTTKKATTKSTAKKAAPKPRTRKPKAEEAVAVPDPAAPGIDDEPLVMDAKDAIAEAPASKGRTTKAQGDPLADVVAEAEAALASAAQSVAGAETVLEGVPAAPETSLGSDRTIIAPTPPQSTIIERVPAPGNSKRLTLTVVFVVIGLIGLAAGYALGTATNDKSDDSENTSPTPVVVNPNTPSTAANGDSNSTVNTNAPAGTNAGRERFSLSGSNPRQSALFELPADSVTLHYDSTGGTFNAKLLPQSGGDGTSFSCSSACDKEQPIQAPAGSYYFDIQSSGGDWNIRVTQ